MKDGGDNIQGQDIPSELSTDCYHGDRPLSKVRAIVELVGMETASLETGPVIKHDEHQTNETVVIDELSCYFISLCIPLVPSVYFNALASLKCWRKNETS